MVLITGADGSIGRAIREFLPGAACTDRSTQDLSTEPLRVPAGTRTVIHLAGLLGEDLDAADANLRILVGVLRGCCRAGVSRLILASSVRAEEERLAIRVTYYGRAKAAGEAMLSAWCAEDATRVGVALRLGHYCPGSTPPLLHEAVRLDTPMLEHWVRAALDLPTPGLTIWSAVGQARG